MESRVQRIGLMDEHSRLFRRLHYRATLRHYHASQRPISTRYFYFLCLAGTGGQKPVGDYLRGESSRQQSCTERATSQRHSMLHFISLCSSTMELDDYYLYSSTRWTFCTARRGLSRTGLDFRIPNSVSVAEPRLELDWDWDWD